MNEFNYTIVKCKVDSVELALEEVKYLYEADVLNSDNNYIYEIVSIE